MPHSRRISHRLAAGRRPVTPNGGPNTSSVPGYTLLQELERARHSRVFIAAPADSPDPLLDRVIVKVYADAGRGRRATEIGRLWQQIDSRHCPQFLDEVMTDGCTVIVSSWAKHGAIAPLLHGRSLRLGEAVTVLVPVLQLLAVLHAHGFAHGALELRNIALDHEGAPVLLGWGQAEHETSPLDDALQFATLCREVLVLGDVDADRDRRVEALLAVLVSQSDHSASLGHVAPQFYEIVEQALFDVADPVPVDPLEPYDWQATSQTMLSVVDAEVDTIIAEKRERGRVRARARSGLTTGSARFADFCVSVGPSLRRAARERSFSLWPGSRARVRLRTLAVAVVVCTVAATGALLATPPHRSAAGAATETGPTQPGPTESAPLQSRPIQPGPIQPEPTESGQTQPGPTVSAPIESGAPQSVTDSSHRSTTSAQVDPTIGDDPRAALVALLTRRDDCFRQSAMSCFDGVDQAGSPALTSDQMAFGDARRTDVLLRTPTQTAKGTASDGGTATGSETRTGGPRWLQITVRDDTTLAQRVGNAATVAVLTTEPGLSPPGSQKPASALLVKGETGWRLREVFVRPG